MANMDVVVVGSCMKDLVCYVSNFPSPGETIPCHRFETGFGGKGANQCVMAAKLGATSAMVAKLGEDDIGHATVANFSSHSINTEHVELVNGVASGVASIAVNQSGENTIIIAPGANDHMDQCTVQKACDLIKNARVVVCQLEIPQSTVKAALLLAKQSGVRTIFNPAPARSDIDETIYSVADILCLNESEAATVTGTQVDSLPAAEQVVNTLLAKDGPGAVLVTMGALGVVYRQRGQPGPHHIPADTVQAVDTTGAGDAFVGALAFYLAWYPGMSLENCIKNSSSIAAVSVQASGTQSSFPSRAQLPDHLFNSEK